MNRRNQVRDRYKQLLLDYFSSQAYAYVLAGVFFVIRYGEIRALFIIGLIFCGISAILLLAPLCNRVRAIALKLDTCFKVGLFVASTAILIIEGILGSLHTDMGKILFWTLLIWLFILVITNAIVISKRIGVVKFLIFGCAAFGLLMIFAGYQQPLYYIIAIIGLLFSIPLLDSILHDKLDARHREERSPSQKLPPSFHQSPREGGQGDRSQIKDKQRAPRGRRVGKDSKRKRYST